MYIIPDRVHSTANHIRRVRARGPTKGTYTIPIGDAKDSLIPPRSDRFPVPWDPVRHTRSAAPTRSPGRWHAHTDARAHHNDPYAPRDPQDHTRSARSFTYSQLGKFSRRRRRRRSQPESLMPRVRSALFLPEHLLR